MTFPIVMNKAKFESLPPDIQKIIDDTTGLILSRKAGVVYDKAEASMKKKVLDSGVKVNDLPKEDLADWKLKGRKIREQWVKETTSEGAPGAAILKEIDTQLGFQ
jgi:TRAP-type C4-dicarboxylate transport system substrate-binding protein